jgi:predicted branched-subunit amino acid permease
VSTSPRTSAVRRAVPAARPVRRPGGNRPRGPIGTAVADIAPVMLGVLPLGTSVGIAARAAAVAPTTGLGTTLLMFGGAANLAALSLVGAGAGAVAVLGTVFVVNARLALYGAGLEPRFRAQPAWFRWLAPHLIVDQTYALAAGRPELGDGARFRRWWLTVGAVLAAGWCAAVAAGFALGQSLPAGSALDVAAPACLVALLVPRLSDRPGVAAAAVAAGVAVAGAAMPQSIGLLGAVVAGVAAGTLMERTGR